MKGGKKILKRVSSVNFFLFFQFFQHSRQNWFLLDFFFVCVCVCVINKGLKFLIRSDKKFINAEQLPTMLN